MHEFSFGQGIVDAALEELERNTAGNGRITKVIVVVGRLHQIIEDNLQMAFEVLSRDTAAEGAVMELRFEEITFHCRACGKKGVVDPPVFLCSGCQSGNLEILTGKELYLEKMEITQAESDPSGGGV